MDTFKNFWAPNPLFHLWVYQAKTQNQGEKKEKQNKTKQTNKKKMYNFICPKATGE